MPVGWNWKNSMSSSGRPRRQVIASAVAGQRVGIRGDLEDLAEAAGREQHGAGAERVHLARRQLQRDHAADPAARPVRHGQVEHLVLVVEGDLGLDALLVERLQDGVTGSVGRVAGAADGRLAVVAGVAAEAALVDQALVGPVEGQAQVLELDDGVDRVAAHHLGRVLVDQVVPALDRVEPVPLPVVLLDVGQGGAHASLGGPGVRPGGIELADDADAGLRPEVLLQLQRRVEAGAAGADHDRVQVVVAYGTLDGRDRGIGSCQAHENGPTLMPAFGSKATTTSRPSSSQTTVIAASIQTSRRRRSPLA